MIFFVGDDNNQVFNRDESDNEEVGYNNDYDAYMRERGNSIWALNFFYTCNFLLVFFKELNG